jgi:hypothetical protein
MALLARLEEVGVAPEAELQPDGFIGASDHRMRV